MDFFGGEKEAPDYAPAGYLARRALCHSTQYSLFQGIYAVYQFYRIPIVWTCHNPAET
jgi:hypothetical protein